MVKKYFHRVVDDVYKFDGTNQAEISAATQGRIVATTNNDVMALPVEGHVILIEKDQYIAISGEGIRIITKEQLDTMYTELPEVVEVDKDSEVKIEKVPQTEE